MSEEKAIARQWVAKSRNDLLYLLALILPFAPRADQLRDDLAVLMPYAIEVRYPDDATAPSEADAKEARESVQRVLGWFIAGFPTLFVP